MILKKYLSFYLVHSLFYQAVKSILFPQLNFLSLYFHFLLLFYFPVPNTHDSFFPTDLYPNPTSRLGVKPNITNFEASSIHLLDPNPSPRLGVKSNITNFEVFFVHLNATLKINTLHFDFHNNQILIHFVTHSADLIRKMHVADICGKS